MDKQTEISLLQQLKGDTYFNQYFNNYDIDQMCENIKNDFAIEYDCQFASKEVELKKKLNAVADEHHQELKRRLQDAKKKLFSFASGALLVESKKREKTITEVCYESIGKLETIKIKAMFGITLEQEEIDYLIMKASGEEE